MDYVEGRGVTSGNEVYFIFDAENDVVVMATYSDAPGVRSDLLQPNIIKTFSKDEWGDINEFLSAGARENEEEEEAEEAESSPLFQQIVPDRITIPKTSDEEKEGLKKLEEMEVDEALAPKVRDEISVLHESLMFSNEKMDQPVSANKGGKLPAMGNSELILPENKVPAMTKEEIQEKFDPITGTQNEDDKEEIEEDGEDEPDISPDDAGRVPESELTEREKELLASGGPVVIHNERLPSMVSVPKMTEDDKEEVEERDEELADVTEREEKEEDGEEDE